MTLRNRIERLEDAFSARGLTPEQLECLVLYCGAGDIPESSVIARQALENSAAYRWAEERLAKQKEEAGIVSDAEQGKRDGAARFFSTHSEEWWLAALRAAFVHAWKRQIPNVPCPLPPIPSLGERGRAGIRNDI